MHRHQGGRSWLRREPELGLQILALVSFSVAQPVLDVLGKSPETFLFRGVGRMGIVAFAAAVVAVPALGLWLLAAAAGAGGARARRIVQRAVVGLLAGVFALQVLKKVTPLPTPLLLVTAVLAGAGSMVAMARARPAREWLRWAALAAPAFVALFLLVSPVSRLVLPARAGAVAERADRTPVVMLVLDELPLLSLLDEDGRIDRRLYPSFAALAGGSTWYRNYTTIERQTTFAIPAMLTGRTQPDRSKVPVAADYPDNLFTLLSGSHRLEVSESLTQLCSPDVCAGSGPGGAAAEADDPRGVGGLPALLGDAARVWLDITLPWTTPGEDTAQFGELVEGGGVERPAESPGPPASPVPGPGSPDPGPRKARGPIRRVAAFEDFLSSLRSSREPTLYYLHLMLPHHPWRFFPSGSEYATPGGITELPLAGTWLDEPWPLELSRQRLRLQVQFADRLLGRLLRGLRRAGLYEDSLLIVTSDHGISVHGGRPHRLTAARSNLHEVLWVPMFVKYPGQDEGAVEDRNADSTDILPTVADVLDIRIPWRTHGHSMRGPSRRGPRKVVDVYRRAGDRVRHEIAPHEAWSRLRAETFRPALEPEDPRLLPYAAGPGAHLIGERVSDLRRGPEAAARAELDLPRGLGRIRPDRPRLPAFVWGRLIEPPPGGEPVVVAAVNGRVAGASATWTHTDGTAGRFAALIPEWFLRPRGNRLELFLLEGEALRPLPAGRPG